VGGLFKSDLPRKTDRRLPEYHPRQWVDCLSPTYPERPIDCFPNTTHGRGCVKSPNVSRRGDRKSLGPCGKRVTGQIRAVLFTTLAIRPTFHTASAVSGLFKSDLPRKTDRLLPEYHPRQWVDCSSPTYPERPIDCFPNTTHGSGWIVQVRPTQKDRSTASRIPPTAVGGLFKSDLYRDAPGIPVSCSYSLPSRREGRER
jgi:hypothetical protein